MIVYMNKGAMADHSSLPNASAMAEAMDAVTADVDKLPGCVAVVVNRDGKTLFQHASGKRGADSNQPMTLESVFWIASCTKMVCGIAVMQLVEQGKLVLDDADLVDKLAPELKAVRILKGFDKDGTPELVEKKNRITLRMLLSHTAGFGYTVFNKEIRLYGQPAGISELDGLSSDILSQPLLFEPGTDWNYGVGLDWAGTLVERASKTPLNDYLQANIFRPLNLHHITMFPTPELRSQLAHMNQKTPSQPIHACDHPLRAPLTTPNPDPSIIYHSAGAGLFARPTDYAQIISVLLNSGLHHPTGHRILQESTVKEMFTNQIPDMPDFGRKGIKTAKPLSSNDIPDLFPQPRSQAQGWGLSFMLLMSGVEGTGRAAGSGWWAGLPNLFWWADPARGVGGLVASQILPFGDPEVLGLWAKIEGMVYQGLDGAKG